MPTTESLANPTAPSGSPAPTTRWAIRAVAVGLALTLFALTVPIVDQLTAHGLTSHLHAVYAGTGVVEPEAWAIVTYLVVVGALGALGWLLILRAIHHRWRRVRGVATGLLVLATVLAVADLTVTEYDTTVLPLWLGVIGLLPCLAGLVAVVLLWRDDASPHGRLAGKAMTVVTGEGRRHRP